MRRVTLPVDRARCPGSKCTGRDKCARYLAMAEPLPKGAIVQDYSITNSIWLHCLARISIEQAEKLVAEAAAKSVKPAHEYIKGLT